MAIEDAAPAQAKKEVEAPPRPLSTARSRSPKSRLKDEQSREKEIEQNRTKEIEEILATAKLPPGQKAVKKLPNNDIERALEAIERKLEAAKGEQAAAKAATVGLPKNKKKQANQHVRELDVAVKGLEQEKQKITRQVKNAKKTEKVMKFNDIGDDPYVMRPRIQIPIQA